MGEYGEAMYQIMFEKGMHNSSVYTAKKLLQLGRDTVEEIAEITELPLEEVKELAAYIEMNDTDDTDDTNGTNSTRE